MNQKELWESKYLKQLWTEPTKSVSESLPFIKKRKAKTILDIGCGTGRDSVLFAKEGFKVTSLDFSGNAINFLKEGIKKDNLSNIKAVCADIDYLNKLKSSSFDVVYAHLTLHYFTKEKTKEIFENIWRILKKKGLLIFSVKTINDDFYGKGTELEQDMFELNGHIRHFFSKEFLEENIQKFNIIKIENEHGMRPDGSPTDTWEVVVEK
jgi:ubiquinone/menaquinone biosynthesis C-methylase UbiE